MSKYAFDMAICTKTGTVNGHAFREGEVYPILGNNNGIHIGYESAEGDPQDLLCFTWGVFAPINGEQFREQDGTIPPLFEPYFPSVENYNALKEVNEILQEENIKLAARLQAIEDILRAEVQIIKHEESVSDSTNVNGALQ